MSAPETNTENFNIREELKLWEKLKKQFSKLQSEERAARKACWNHMFPEPKEGSRHNKYDLGDGRVVTGTLPMDRKIDAATLQTFREAAVAGKLTPEQVEVWNSLPWDTLVTWEPKLSTSVYRTLTEEQHKLFDQMVIVKDGSYSFEIKDKK